MRRALTPVQSRSGLAHRTFAGLAVVLLAGCTIPNSGTDDASTPSGASPTPQVRTYAQPDEGWTMQYPTGWKTQSFDEQGRVTMRGALASNTDMQFVQADCGEYCYTTEWDLSKLPPDGAVAQFATFSGGAVSLAKEATPFPLDYNDLQWRTDKFGNQQGNMPVAVDTGGNYLTTFQLDVTTGPKVSDADLTSLRQVVASISFPDADIPDAPPSTALPYLAVQAHKPKAFMTALFHGVLVERNGCVVADTKMNPTLVYWPPGYSLQPGEAGRIELLGDSGKVVATLGEPTHFGGGYTGFGNDREALNKFLAEPIPSTCQFNHVWSGWF
jgi:hypothetical protein